MKRFSALLDALAFTPARNAKLRLIGDYLGHAPDPDRGWALAALTGALELPTAKPAMIRALVAEKVDPALFAMSYDYVGDLAETVALILPDPPEPAPGLSHLGEPPRLGDVVERLRAAGRREVPALLGHLLDTGDATARWALLKLITGALRVGVSARLAKTAFAERFGLPLDEVEEVWHGLHPPYLELFAWGEGRAPRPAARDPIGFRPPMLSTPLDEAALGTVDLHAYRVEWKWDGIRVQIAAADGEARLYSRTGDDIGGAFPDLVPTFNFDAVLDGELLVAGAGGDGPPFTPAPFNDLQQRLNRKTVSAKVAADHPAFVRLYDILFDEGEDLRGLPFDARRRRLEAWYVRRPRPRLDLSPLLNAVDAETLHAMRHEAASSGIEGLMLKRRDSTYVAGRPKGPWFKWKRDPHLFDAVLMYAQRGHGKRSSFYSDFTFGAWRDGPQGPELVPVGKAYFGFTDAELAELDRWVRNKTVERFGPVRAVAPELVFEVAFDSVARSGRHRSGVAMRFPRISRIRWDKPAVEADRLETLEALIDIRPEAAGSDI